MGGNSLGICDLRCLRLKLQVPLPCLWEWLTLFHMDLLYCGLLQTDWAVQWARFIGTRTIQTLGWMWASCASCHGHLLHTLGTWCHMCTRFVCAQTADICSTGFGLANMLSLCTAYVTLWPTQACLGIQRLEIWFVLVITFPLLPYECGRPMLLIHTGLWVLQCIHLPGIRRSHPWLSQGFCASQPTQVMNPGHSASGVSYCASLFLFLQGVTQLAV